MDKNTLAIEVIEDGRRFIRQFAEDGYPVQGAFWMSDDDNEQWWLYIVTGIVDDEGSLAAYRAVRGSAKKIEDSLVTDNDIKVIGAKDPIAIDLHKLAERDTSSGPTVTKFSRTVLGRMVFERLYLYPNLAI